MNDNDALIKFLDETKAKLLQIHEDTKAILDDRDLWKDIATKKDEMYRGALNDIVKLQRKLELANQKIKALEGALDMKNIVEKK